MKVSDRDAGFDPGVTGCRIGGLAPLGVDKAVQIGERRGINPCRTLGARPAGKFHGRRSQGRGYSQG